jgi:pSer/pThr/pTyr-binding forkhead associated (FHA) protein
MAANKNQVSAKRGPAPRSGLFVRVESGFYQGLEWSLDRPSTVIGRGRSADLILSEATISRAHAMIGFKGDKLFVQDLDSTNGTLVNGMREHQAELQDGDEVRMGRLRLRIGSRERAEAV